MSLSGNQFEIALLRQVDVETYKPVDYHKFSYGDLPPRPPRDFKMELAKQMLRAAAQQKSW
eukprot:5298028-Amphidinium_carterae.1